MREGKWIDLKRANQAKIVERNDIHFHSQFGLVVHILINCVARENDIKRAFKRHRHDHDDQIVFSHRVVVAEGHTIDLNLTALHHATARRHAKKIHLWSGDTRCHTKVDVIASARMNFTVRAIRVARSENAIKILLANCLKGFQV